MRGGSELRQCPSVCLTPGYRLCRDTGPWVSRWAWIQRADVRTGVNKKGASGDSSSLHLGLGHCLSFLTALAVMLTRVIGGSAGAGSPPKPSFIM